MRQRMINEINAILDKFNTPTIRAILLSLRKLKEERESWMKN